MWNIIILIFQYGPALVKLIREIIALMKDLSDDEKKEAEAELMKAKDDYKLFRDRKPLTDLRDRLKRKCEGKKCSQPD
jgi:hypothetical protein